MEVETSAGKAKTSEGKSDTSAGKMETSTGNAESSAGKVVVNVFWDGEGMLLMELFERHFVKN